MHAPPTEQEGDLGQYQSAGNVKQRTVKSRCPTVFLTGTVTRTRGPRSNARSHYQRTKRVIMLRVLQGASPVCNCLPERTANFYWKRLYLTREIACRTVSANWTIGHKVSYVPSDLSLGSSQYKNGVPAVLNRPIRPERRATPTHKK